jgi:hypothetical protein
MERVRPVYSSDQAEVSREEVTDSVEPSTPLFDEVFAGQMLSALGSPDNTHRQQTVGDFFKWLGDLTPSREAADFLLMAIEQPWLRSIRLGYGESCHTRAVATLLNFGFPHALKVKPEDLNEYRTNTQNVLLRPFHNPWVWVVGIAVPTISLLAMIYLHW